jgi:hypothetical protein
MVVNVRTQDDLRELLRNRASGNWNIGVGTEPRITKVRVFNWDNDQVLKGDFNRARSRRDADDDLIIGISKCRIENFRAGERFFDIFGMAAVVYTPYVPIQRVNGMTSGIIRGINFAGRNQNEIDEFFKRLISEIRLRGITNIVFRAGGIPIPDFFTDWCQQNGVNIQILPDEELDRIYPEVNDILCEDELFDENQNEDIRG